MAEEPDDASAAAKKPARDTSNTPADGQRAEAPGLAVEREELWDASALSPAGSLSEGDLSPGVRAALEQIFPTEQPRLRRVAEQGAVYGAEPTDGAGEGIEALAGGYGVTLAALAARLDLSEEVLRAPFAGAPPALLAEVAKALRAPIAEVAMALRAESHAESHAEDSAEDRAEDDDGGQAPDEARPFADVISTAPSLSEEQRRRWLALLATGPA